MYKTNNTNKMNANNNNNNNNTNANANAAPSNANTNTPSISKNRTIAPPAGVWGKKPAFAVAPAPEVKVEVAPAPEVKIEVKIEPVKTKTMSRKVQQIAAKSKFGALIDEESEDDAQEAEDEPESSVLQTTVLAQQELLDPEDAAGFTSTKKPEPKPKAPKARVEICRDGPSCLKKTTCQRIHFSKNFCRNGVACQRCKDHTCIYRPNSKVCPVAVGGGGAAAAK
jgi:hypothetical protein